PAPAPDGASSGAADAVRAAADALRGVGDVVILWGERLTDSAGGIEALLALASALEIADKPESGLIEIPAGGNGRGLREVGCLPTVAPGLADAPAEGMSTAEILAAAGGDIANLLLVQADVPAAALDAATATIAFAQFRTEALDDHATIVFPAEIYAEKEGTITHPDGRLQRVRQTLGRANEVRPGWQVLEDLLDLLGSPTGALAAPMVTAQLTEAVPFYAGITLDEIGGTGVRWQDRDAASAVPATSISGDPLEVPPPRPEGLRLAAAPALWSGPAVQHSPSLRFLLRGDHAELSIVDARRLGVSTGDPIELVVDGRKVVAEARVRTGVPAGSVFLSPPVLPDGPVEITPARVRARAEVGA
ncbi:MAG: molybdopterin-dependent oxidoreductase, partial [Thermoleophilaceae bacterium]